MDCHFEAHCVAGLRTRFPTQGDPISCSCRRDEVVASGHHKPFRQTSWCPRQCMPRRVRASIPTVDKRSREFPTLSTLLDTPRVGARTAVHLGAPLASSRNILASVSKSSPRIVTDVIRDLRGVFFVQIVDDFLRLLIFKPINTSLAFVRNHHFDHHQREMASMLGPEAEIGNRS